MINNKLKIIKQIKDLIRDIQNDKHSVGIAKNTIVLDKIETIDLLKDLLDVL